MLRFVLVSRMYSWVSNYHFWFAVFRLVNQCLCKRWCTSSC